MTVVDTRLRVAQAPEAEIPVVVTERRMVATRVLQLRLAATGATPCRDGHRARTSMYYCPAGSSASTVCAARRMRANGPPWCNVSGADVARRICTTNCRSVNSWQSAARQQLFSRTQPATASSQAASASPRSCQWCGPPSPLDAFADQRSSLTRIRRSSRPVEGDL
jgi:hypothetical protein